MFLEKNSSVIKNTLVLRCLLVVLCSIFFVGNVMAWQPTQSISIIVPNPAGGNVDIIARIINQGLETQGVKSTVLNVPGAQAAIGINQVIKSKNDGHTVLLTPTSFMFNLFLQENTNLTYQIDDLNHIILIGTVENHVYANSTQTKNKSLREIVSDMKFNKNSYTWGVTNAGANFIARLMKKSIGDSMIIIPYNGGPPAYRDIQGGHIDLVIDSGTSVLGRSSNNNIKQIGTLNSKSSNQDTVDEFIPGIVSQSWFGLSLPKDTHPDIINWYKQTIVQVLEQSETRKKLEQTGLVISNQKNRDFSTWMKKEYEKFKSLSK